MDLNRLAEHLGGPRCVGCGLPDGILCRACRADIPRAHTSEPVPNVDRVVAAWLYDDTARSLVLAMKARGRRGAAYELGRAIADRVWERGIVADALVWVPGKRADIRNRGFDHAQLIARVVSQKLGIPAFGGLARLEDRRDQTALGARERRANLEGAFRSMGGPRRVAVVDDLMTTGATLSEAGRALRQAGATRIEGLIGCLVAHPAMTTTI